MPRVIARLRNVAIVLGLSLSLGACVVAPARPGYYGGAYVAVAPPPPRVEYYGAPPYPGYFWIGGFWRWGPGGYFWAPGHWTAPRPGFRWVPRHWVRGPRGWHMAGGRWARR
jgi:WXXGXW repeat (2 copies)